MKNATLNTEWGEIEISVEGGEYYGRPEHMLRCGEAELRFEPPDIENPGDPAFARIRHRRQLSSDRCADLARLCLFAEQLIGLFEKANAEARAEAVRREEEEAAARKAVITERGEILMQELVGERVKVRHRGYKTMCYGEVHVVPLYGESQDRYFRVAKDEEPTGYRPRIRYSDQGDARDRGVESYVRLDVKTARGWRTVWDDGKDDLPEYDRAVKLPQVKPYN